MRDRLCLQKQLISDTDIQYVFEQGGKTMVLSEVEAKALIAACPPNKRNCRISGDLIGMKPNEGKLLREYINAVYIYTKKKYFVQCHIMSHDLWFRRVMYDREFLKQQKDIIWKIDKAKVTDYKTLQIVTPYGQTEVDNLSTGLKAILNVRYVMQKDNVSTQRVLICADDCGDNILPYLFQDICNSNVCLYITHPIMHMPKGYTIYVNGKLLEDVCTFAEHIEA